MSRLFWDFQKWTKINVHFWISYSTLDKIFDFSTFYIKNQKEGLKNRQGRSARPRLYNKSERGLKERPGLSARPHPLNNHDFVAHRFG